MRIGRVLRLRREQRPALATFTALLAVAAFLSPLWAAEPDRASGLMLLGGVGAELVHSFRRRTFASQRSAWASAGFTLLLALVLLNTSWVAATALAIFVAAPFALDGARRAAAASRHAVSGKPFLQDTLAASGNLAAVIGVLLLGRYALNWVVGVAAGVRLATVTANITAGASYSEDDIEESVVAD